MTVVTRPPRVTVAHGRPGARRNVVEEIAARRRSDVLAELGRHEPGRLLAAAIRAAPEPRPIVARLAAPGLHLIAELKRSSPSAGRIAAGGDDLVARARAYEAGGATAISVLCEPHWFGGSLDDLRAVRAAVGLPVLAKEFVVEEIQLPLLRAAGADLVLLLAVLHPARRLARLVHPKPRARDGAAGRGARPTGARTGPRQRCAADRAQQPGPADPRGRPRARGTAARARARRSAGHRRVRRARAGDGRPLACARLRWCAGR